MEWGILGVALVAYNTYLIANQINDRAISNMDKYLPKKKYKGILFWFYGKEKKGQPVRWLSYWIEYITQHTFIIFILSVLLEERFETLDFVNRKYIAIWGLFFFVYPAVFEIAVDIYVFFMDRKNKEEDI